MKKLISLLAALAVVTTGTVAFAAETTTEVDVTNKVNATNEIEAGDDGLYSVTASSTADQATILAIKGKTIKVGAIQYINQEATDNGSATFKFALNDELLANETSAAITDDVYVLTGGDGTVTGAGYIDVTPEASTGATVNGTIVDEIVSQVPFEDMANDFDEETMETFKSAWKTNAYLFACEVDEEGNKDLSNAFAYLDYYTGAGDMPEAVASTVVDSVSGAYSFTDVAAGTYVLIIANEGSLPYFKYVTVANGDTVDVGSVTLKAGDLDCDIGIGGSDIDVVLGVMGSAFGEDGYSAVNDLDCDFSVGGSDIDTILATFGGDIASEYGSEQAVKDMFGL